MWFVVGSREAFEAMIPGAFESMTGEQPTTRDYEGTESPRCGPGIFVCKKLVTSVESDKSPHHRCHKLKAQSTSRRPPGNNDDLIFHAPASPCTIIDDKKQLLTKSTGVGSVALRGGIQEGWLPPMSKTTSMFKMPRRRTCHTVAQNLTIVDLRCPNTW